MNKNNIIINAPINNATPDLGPTGKTPVIPNDIVEPGSDPESLRSMTADSIKDIQEMRSNDYKDIFSEKTLGQPYGRIRGFFEGAAKSILDPVDGISQMMIHGLSEHGFVGHDTSEKFDHMISDQRRTYDQLTRAHSYYATAGEFAGAMIPAGRILKGIELGMKIPMAAKIVSQVIKSSPKLGGLAAAGLKGGAVAGALSALSPIDVGEDRATKFEAGAGWGTIFGVAGRMFAPTVEYGVMKITPKVQAGLKYTVDKIASSINVMGDFANKLKSKLDYDIDAAKFWYAAKKIGIENESQLQGAPQRAMQAVQSGIGQITAGAITRIPAVQQRETKLLETSEKFREIYQNISKNIFSASQDFIHTIGKIGKFPFSQEEKITLGKNIQDFLINHEDDAHGIINDAYGKISSTAGAEINLPLKEFSETMKIINEQGFNPTFNEKINGFIQEMRNRLNPREDEPGKLVNIAGQPLIQANRTKIPTPFTTVSELTGLITELNKYGRTLPKTYANNNTHASIIMLRNMAYKTIDYIADDVTNTAKELFDSARQARLHLDDVFGQRDIVESAIAMKDRLTTVLPYEALVRRIFGGVQPLENLNRIETALKYNIPTKEEFLTKKGKETSINPRGLELWDNLRAGGLADIVSKSYQNINGIPTLIPNRLIQDFNDRPHIYKKLFADDALFNKYESFIKTLDHWSNKSDGDILKGVSEIKKTTSELQREALKEGRFVGHHALNPIVSSVIGFFTKIGNSFINSRQIAANLLISRMLSNRGKIPSQKAYESTRRITNNFLTNISASVLQPSMHAYVPKTPSVIEGEEEPEANKINIEKENILEED